MSEEKQEQEKAKEEICATPNLIIPEEVLSTKLKDFSYSSSTNSLLYQPVTEGRKKENDSLLLEETTTTNWSGRCQRIVNDGIEARYPSFTSHVII